jgi:transposase
MELLQNPGDSILYLYYLPPYSPELNRIEILWKHFRRHFIAKNGADLIDEIQPLMRGFRSKFTINFAWLLRGLLD